MSESKTLVVSAPAKVNLYLTITGRRADGLHLIDSLVAFTTLGDELRITPGERLDVTCTGPFSANMPLPYKNLVYLAAQQLADAAGVSARADIAITKNLPIAAGIGGGSSDAAATLRTLVKAWGLSDKGVDLDKIGLTLGSDLPVCILGETSYAGGIGEVLTPGPKLPNAGLLLVNPGVGLVTSSVYGARKGGFSPVNRFKSDPQDAAELAAMLEDRENDLTRPAIRLCPVIRDVLSALNKAPGCHLGRMTGSGATCFGIFDDRAAAEAAKASVAREGWWVEATEIAG
ncbi:MAG: 4-(cytidine 5'-diphospho)-2-C-methyl-D-erythritol kinase [Alphaproteobacteria bacterium]|nr:4-(cytidine 5'-diphospho)-2-C-methyl-D-erythritol kinase [Alphaproteobacteria bacterium]